MMAETGRFSGGSTSRIQVVSFSRLSRFVRCTALRAGIDGLVPIGLVAVIEV